MQANTNVLLSLLLQKKIELIRFDFVIIDETLFL